MSYCGPCPHCKYQGEECGRAEDEPCSKCGKAPSEPVATYSVVFMPTQKGHEDIGFKRTVLESGVSRATALLLAHEAWADDPSPDKADYYNLIVEQDTPPAPTDDEKYAAQIERHKDGQ